LNKAHIRDNSLRDVNVSQFGFFVLCANLAALLCKSGRLGLTSKFSIDGLLGLDTL